MRCVLYIVAAEEEGGGGEVYGALCVGIAGAGDGRWCGGGGDVERREGSVGLMGVGSLGEGGGR